MQEKTICTALFLALPIELLPGAMMLHTALVISAYMSMILVPCACAQWGDVLTAEWRTLRRGLRLDMRRRREGMSEALIRSLREARAAAQIAALASIAFVEPKPLPRIIFKARKFHFGRPRPRVRVVDPISFERAYERVKMRLCQLSEAFRQANTIFAMPGTAFAMAGGPAISMASPRVSMSSVAPPMVNFAPRHKEPLAPAAVEPVAAPAVVAAPPAIAAKSVQPEIAAQSTLTAGASLEDRLTRRLFDQVGAFRRPAKTEIAPQEYKTSHFTSLSAAIEPSPLLHFPPSPAELEALFALDSQEAPDSSEAILVGVKESSAKISAAA
jgi:hypothetical protein